MKKTKKVYRKFFRYAAPRRRQSNTGLPGIPSDGEKSVENKLFPGVYREASGGAVKSIRPTFKKTGLSHSGNASTAAFVRDADVAGKILDGSEKWIQRGKQSRPMEKSDGPRVSERIHAREKIDTRLMIDFPEASTRKTHAALRLGNGHSASDIEDFSGIVSPEMGTFLRTDPAFASGTDSSGTTIPAVKSARSTSPVSSGAFHPSEQSAGRLSVPSLSPAGFSGDAADLLRGLAGSVEHIEILLKQQLPGGSV